MRKQQEPLALLLTSDERNEACRLYQEGLNCPAIARKFDVHTASIRRLLQSRNILLRPPPITPMHTEVETAEICEEYLEGKSANLIAIERNVSIMTILKALKRNGVEQRSGSEIRRKYNCNHSFFDNIDSEAKAYWLGFIAADGYVSKGKRKTSPELYLSLGIKDREHIVRFKDVLESTHPVREYDYSDRGGGTNYPYASFSVRSEQLTTALAKFGIVPRKCHTFEWPNLSPSVSRHFLRGYFDGDGCWNIKRVYGANGKSAASKRLDIAFSITSDRRFLEGCQSFLQETLGVSKTKFSDRYRSGKYSASTLIYSGRIQVSRLFHLMYDDATIYLPRKYERAVPYIL